MSLTGVSPLITDWMRLGLRWKYLWGPKLKPFTIPARGSVQIPSEGYTFLAPEGIIINLNTIFDHPKCGIRLECFPNLDTADFLTVERFMALGNVNIPLFLSAYSPPMTPPGLYGIAQNKEWGWKGSMKLHLFNVDTVDHTCIMYAYTVAVLEEERPVVTEDLVLNLCRILSEKKGVG